MDKITNSTRSKNEVKQFVNKYVVLLVFINDLCILRCSVHTI